jgi:hypothetical protein
VTGDGNGWVQAGEAGDLYLSLCNRGGDDLHQGARLALNPLDDWLEVTTDTVALPEILMTATNRTSAISYHVTEDAPDRMGALVRATVEVDSIQKGEGLILLPTSGELDFTDDLDAEPVWLRSYSVTYGYNNVWRWRADAGDGSGGLAFAGLDSTPHPPRADAALELPLLMLGGDAVLEIRHRLAVEMDYDGGMVEIDRGDGWELAWPEAGYNGSAVDNGSFPGGSCWSGEFGWQEDRFNIDDIDGSLRIRLRFVADNGIELEGWFIDRIVLNGSPYEVDLPAAPPLTFNLVEVYPNPFNNSFSVNYTLAEAGLVTLQIFDVAGRSIKMFHEGYQPMGNHFISHDASSLPAGVYLLNLQCDGVKAVVKIVNIR